MKRTILLCIMFLVIAQGTVWAQIPQTISYQGILKDAGGAVVPDGQYWLEFRLYDAPEGGNELWVESHTGVQVVNGVFNVILGSMNAFGLPFDREYWLSVSVEGKGELTPRVPLTASPYSLNARSVSGTSNVFPSDGGVGIGTTNPDWNLHIVGAGDVPEIRLERDQGSGVDYAAKITVGEHNGAVFGTYKNHAVHLFSNNLPRVTVSGDGNVGIGTTSPGAKLDVVADDNYGQAPAFFQGFDFNEGDPRAYIWLRHKYGPDNPWGMAVDRSGNFALHRMAGFDALSINYDNGNVGIGFQSPVERLEVEGNISTSGNVAAQNFYCNVDNGRVRVGHLGGIESGGGISFYPDTDQNGDDDIIWYDNGPNEVMRISSDGNVGIGTNSPGAQLHATGNWILGSTSGFPGFGVSGWLNSDSGILYEGGGGGWAHHFSAYGGGDIVRFGTSGGSGQEPDTKVVIKNDGGVGIGTTTPENKLHVELNTSGAEVVAAFRNAGTIGDTQARIQIQRGDDAGTGVTRGLTIFTTNVNSGLGDYENRNLSFYTGSGATATEKMTITKDGNVGIGTTSPGNILTVVQNSSTDPIADAWTTYSSRRWKTNIKPIEKALDKIERLRGVSFDWKADGKHDIGLIAEEVGQVIPELVAYEDNAVDAKSVDYSRLIPVLIEAVKEQQKEIDKQQETIDELVGRIAVIEAGNHLTSR